jgi:hypothetical protein
VAKAIRRVAGSSPAHGLTLLVGDEDAIYKHGCSFCRLFLFNEVSNTTGVKNQPYISPIQPLSRCYLKPDPPTIRLPTSEPITGTLPLIQSLYLLNISSLSRNRKSCGGVVAIISQVWCSSSLCVPKWRYSQGGGFFFSVLLIDKW